ncbi:phosphatase PAP2 family protein [Paenibacillus sedimenti]|uniref:Phosphatase PAP2 family protein n=1 Tax=Paenibacillus sedimenti TaxID=2770274 RepID=A0A926QIL7_9BACL|nr:phosphatase PAP2 family protein [Paenibacillus sedimenti]MBD0379467.1 phosphatase PAP2 family protein [Paenibacillus sedimenti]
MQGKRLYKDLLWGFAAAFILLVGFVVLSQSLASGWLESFDVIVTDAIQSTRSDGLTPIAKFFTTLGKGSTEFILFFMVAALFLFKFKHRWETLILFLGVLGTWGLNTLLKGIFERARPVGQRLIEEDGFSFPSGHAMVSSLFYGLIGYLLWINLRRTWKGAWLIPVITVLVIICIGLSRVYLGVHYPSDVLAGFAAGVACLIGCILAIQVIRNRRSIKK